MSQIPSFPKGLLASPWQKTTLKLEPLQYPRDFDFGWDLQVGPICFFIKPSPLVPGSESKDPLARHNFWNGKIPLTANSPMHIGIFQFLSSKKGLHHPFLRNSPLQKAPSNDHIGPILKIPITSRQSISKPVTKWVFNRLDSGLVGGIFFGDHITMKLLRIFHPQESDIRKNDVVKSGAMYI